MRWEFDPSLSQVQWEVGYLGIAFVRGFFNKFQVSANLDGDDPAAWAVEATIDVASVDSGVPDRDKHLCSADYFHVEQYPTITFASRRVERNGDSYRVVGDFSLHGVEREVILDARIGGDATDPRGNHRRGFSATTTLDRNEFNLGAGSAGRDVRVDIDVQLIRRE